MFLKHYLEKVSTASNAPSSIESNSMFLLLVWIESAATVFAVFIWACVGGYIFFLNIVLHFFWGIYNSSTFVHLSGLDFAEVDFRFLPLLWHFVFFFELHNTCISMNIVPSCFPLIFFSYFLTVIAALSEAQRKHNKSTWLIF